MPSTRTPTFVVKTHTPGVYDTPAAWPTKHLGRPTDASLATYVADFEASCKPGGVNAHLGFRPVRRAVVIRQSTGAVVAEYTAPMFQVI